MLTCKTRHVVGRQTKINVPHDLGFHLLICNNPSQTTPLFEANSKMLRFRNSLSTAIIYRCTCKMIAVNFQTYHLQWGLQINHELLIKNNGFKRERNGRLILLLGDFFFSLTGRGKIRELVFAEIGVFTLQIGACRI